MERKPEHLAEVPSLRPEFISQPSWDEWAAENTPFFVHPNAREIVEKQMSRLGLDGCIFEDALDVAKSQWRETLNPDTRFSEVLYLEGYTLAQRWHIVEQTHAAIVERAVKIGFIEERPDDKLFRQEFGE